jgi:predicted DCC family thiol-disulfide oxidoreductase YuxK
MTTPFYLRGPYRYVRNPGALLVVVLGVAVGVWLLSPLLVVAIVAAAGAWHYTGWRSLEAMWERQFGDAYRLYRRRVRCWRPRLRGYDPAREAEEPPLAAERTAPPGRYLVFYDGHCKFCQAGSERLIRLAQTGTVERLDFQAPAALDPFPGLTHAACMRQMFLVTPDGRVYGGFEAAVRALATRPVVGWLAFFYYVPGIRLVCDLLYALVAAHRYRILGRAVAAGECAGGTCSVHSPKHAMREDGA